jgi:hypothetical protein
MPLFSDRPVTKIRRHKPTPLLAALLGVNRGGVKGGMGFANRAILLKAPGSLGEE